MRTLGFGEGRQAEQTMPEALGRRPGAKRIQPLPLRPLFLTLLALLLGGRGNHLRRLRFTRNPEYLKRYTV
jgi:hypothetical protein